MKLSKKIQEKLDVMREEYNLEIINMRNIKSNNKTRLVLTLKCKQCGQRFDIRWDTLQWQKHKGLCTSCAHKESSAYRVLQIDEIIKRFTDEGFKVLTPIDKIKPRGKRNIYFTPVDIQNKYGDIYTVNCNNFCTRIDYYRELSNCDAKNDMLKTESRLEYKVRKFLEEQNIPYKTQFRFMDCRGEKYPLPFDFCLYYTEDNRLLIEVDGEQHFRKSTIWANSFEPTQKNDRRKNYYCQQHNIPLLRLTYLDIDAKSERYKDMILDFIKNNR